MLVGLNTLAIEGGAATVTLAVAVLPVPPLVELTAPVVLVYAPAVAPVTVTLNWHWPPTAMVAPVNEIPVGAVVVSVPPQTVDVPLATVNPVGSVSVNATPVSGTVLAGGFVIVKVSVVVVLSAIVVGLKALAIDGGATTIRLAVAVLPVPPLVELTFPVLLIYAPAVAPVTVTLNGHWPFTAMVAPVNVIPVGAVVVRVPPHTVDVLLATVSPVGSVSVKATPVAGSGLAGGLVMMKVSDVVAFSAIVVGLNALNIDGGASTLRLAVAMLPVPPSFEVTAPVMLLNAPAVVPVTVTLNWHWLLAATVAPVNEIPVGAVVVSVPPHTVDVLLATVRPIGSVSVNPTPVSEIALGDGLVIVNCNDEVVFKAMLVGLNALAIDGGAMTVRFAVAVLPVPPLVELTFPVVFVY
jgi:hypothetical protein